MPEQITVYRSGSFTTEPMPDFLAEALDRVSDTDWQSSTEKELNATLVQFAIEGFTPLPLYRLDQGAYFELELPEATIGSVWIPDDADIVPFLSQHVAPIVRMLASSHRLGAVIRIGNILHTIADERFDVDCEWSSGKSNRRSRKPYARMTEGARRRADTSN